MSSKNTAPQTQRSIGYIHYLDGTKEKFKASSPKTAIIAAMKTLNLQNLSSTTFKKARGFKICFADRVIFPLKRKRTLDTRRDRMVNRERPVISRSEGIDIGRKRHYNLPLAA